MGIQWNCAATKGPGDFAPPEVAELPEDHPAGGDWTEAEVLNQVAGTEPADTVLAEMLAAVGDGNLALAQGKRACLYDLAEREAVRLYDAEQERTRRFAA